MARRPAVVAKADIHKQLWPDTFVSDATLVGLVKELRRALDDHEGAFIRTAHRVGYAFAAFEHQAPDRASTRRCWLVAGTRRFALQDGVNVIGRDPDTDVTIDVAGVSRRHAQIIVSDGAATIEDLGSKNGTSVDGTQLTGPHTLADGDQIRLGSVLVTFRIPPSADSTEILV